VDFGIVLALVGLVLAWVIYRLERLAARHRDIDAALATLRAVRRGMVGRDEEPGWGELYFQTIWAGDRLKEQAGKASAAVLDGATSPVPVVQTYVAPTEPVRLLASAPHAGDLIANRTLSIANLALWQIHVFNQLVDAQTNWLTIHAQEIADPDTTPERRALLAKTARSLSWWLHARGVGEANAIGGWYRRLKEAVDADVERLGEARKRGLWPPAVWWLGVVDMIAAASAVGLVIWSVMEVT
jgi:hypothetical protein